MTRPDTRKNSDAAPFACEGLDRTIHERARLGILSSLVAHDGGLSFVALKRVCALTDGNLNRHLQILREAGMVTLDKGYDGTRPQTLCRLTPAGRDRFLAYLEVLDGIVRDAARAAEALDSDAPTDRKSRFGLA